MASYRDKALELKKKHPEYAAIDDLDLILKLLPHHREWKFDDLPLEPPPEPDLLERIFPVSGASDYVKRLRSWEEQQRIKATAPLNIKLARKTLENDLNHVQNANDAGVHRDVLKDVQAHALKTKVDLAADRERNKIKIEAMQTEARETIVTELAWTGQYLEEMRQYSDAIAAQKKKIRTLTDPIDIEEAQRHLNILEAQYAQRAQSAQTQASGPRPGQKP